MASHEMTKAQALEKLKKADAEMKRLYAIEDAIIDYCRELSCAAEHLRDSGSTKGKMKAELLQGVEIDIEDLLRE